MPRLSVREQLRDGVVFLTGGLGFLGSVTLEKLLRCTDVTAVYLLVRSKRGVPASTRVESLLSGPLFNALHKQAAEGGTNVFGKVMAVEGDMSLPGLGLSPAHARELAERVTHVVHCAADLSLDAHIQQAIRCNYLSTQQLLVLAGQMTRLRSLVFASTYWVNNFKPYNTPVRELVHNITLQLPGEAQALTHSQFVARMLAMQPADADREAAALLRRLNFVSTYGFSKVLAEQLLNEPDCLPGVAKVIVRPSLISNTAYGPYPGYLGGFAGSPGYIMGYGIGMFHSTDAVAFSSDALVDIIPCDTVAALLLAAGAAGAAHGPYARGAARVYHATSASSHPGGTADFFQRMHCFWSANPPPFRLPWCRYPTVRGRHQPTWLSLALGKLITGAKVYATARVLQALGNSRKARTLVNGFKAFCVQNTLGYARSIVSRIDNVRELERSLVREERSEWRCCWDAARDLDWDTYSYTSLAGILCQAFKRSEVGVVTPVPHMYKRLPVLADPSLLAAEGPLLPAAAAKAAHADEGEEAACGEGADGIPAGEVEVAFDSDAVDVSDDGGSSVASDGGASDTGCSLDGGAGSDTDGSSAA